MLRSLIAESDSIITASDAMTIAIVASLATFQGPNWLGAKILAFTYQCKTPLNARATVFSKVVKSLGLGEVLTLEIRLGLALRGVLHFDR